MLYKNNKSIPKAIVLVFAITAMIPIAANLDNISGSVYRNEKEVSSEPTEEKKKLEGKIEDLKTQIEKLTEIINNLEVDKR